MIDGCSLPHTRIPQEGAALKGLVRILGGQQGEEGHGAVIRVHDKVFRIFP